MTDFAKSVLLQTGSGFFWEGERCTNISVVIGDIIWIHLAEINMF